MQLPGLFNTLALFLFASNTSLPDTSPSSSSSSLSPISNPASPLPTSNNGLSSQPTPFPTRPPPAFRTQHQHPQHNAHHAHLAHAHAQLAQIHAKAASAYLHEARAATTTWSAVGCATDGPSRALTATSTVTPQNSIEYCESFCYAAGYMYAGVEFGDECYCGNSIANGLGQAAPASDCNVACAANSAETCGGGYRLNIFSVSTIAAAPTTTASAAGGWSSLGCKTDGGARALTATMTTTNGLTVEACESFCAAGGYTYMGVEYGTQCFCGNSLANGLGSAASAGDCNMPCGGNSAETCGGSYRMNLYSQAGAIAAPTTTATAAAGSWTAIGCATDGGARALTAASTTTSGNSVEFCESFCYAAGYAMAGVEYGQECYCGNSFANGLGGSASAGDCNVPCSGNSGETCGGSYRLNLYSRAGATGTITSTPTSAATGAAGSWASLGCATDGPSRALAATSTVTSGNSVEFCESFCAAAGYSMAGVEYGQECYCGNSLVNGLGQAAPSGDCNVACAGNSAETCGGGYRLNLYSRSGATATPTPTGWSSLGCATDGPSRALAATSTITSGNTIESCESFCAAAGYVYAGVEYGQECYCANSIGNGLGQAAPASDCNVACAGNSAETCGGGYRLNIYSRSGATATTTAAPTTTGWSALGCATDASSRVLTATMTQSSGNSFESCGTFCKGYTYMGVEDGNECYCGNSLSNGGASYVSASQCSVKCAGNSTETCGGPWLLNLYKNVGAAPTTSSWTSLGCATDVPARALTGSTTTTNQNTVEYCETFCVGYTYMGVEDGNQCFCGNSLANGGGTAAASTDCNVACAGNSSEMCGGNYRLNLYTMGGTAPAAVAPAFQIWDIWQTTYQQQALFQRLSLSQPVNFTTPGAIGQADIVVTDSTTYQNIDGFGAALTDSAALILSNLKNTNSGNYWNLLHTLFDPTDGSATAALSMIRVPLGATDFSASVYSFNDQQDTNLNEFNLNVAPSYLWSTLTDIMSINSGIKIIVSPWSMPAWMKDSNSMLGGNFLPQYTNTLALYLLKCVQGFQSKGFPVYYVSLQNEPENTNPTYPTALIDADTAAAVATQLRTLLNQNGFGSTKIVAWEHNWDQAANYPVQEVNDSPNAFTGASFHCYGGDVSDQMSFYNAHPDKEIYFSECTGTFGSDWWSDIKWNMDNLMIGSLSYYSRSVVLYNIALDGNGNPKLPGTNSCGGTGCRAVVTVNSDGSYLLNQEYYCLAQASRAIVPKDSGGPFGQRIGVSVGGSLNYELVVGAYKTGRSAAANTDWNRYSLVVMNWDDNTNAEAVPTTIEFRGVQAQYTFPIGVTTLWWYAEN